MSAAEWFLGKTCGPKMINLESGFTPAAPREFVSSAPAVPLGRLGTMTQHEPTLEGLSRENTELKRSLTEKESRIKQLEEQLKQLK